MTDNTKSLVTAIFIGISMMGAGVLLCGIFIIQIPVIIVGVLMIGIGAFAAFMTSIKSKDNNPTIV